MTRIVGTQGETAVSVGATGHRHKLPTDCDVCVPYLVALGFVYENEAQEAKRQSDFDCGFQAGLLEVARRIAPLNLDPKVVEFLLSTTPDTDESKTETPTQP